MWEKEEADGKVIVVNRSDKRAKENKQGKYAAAEEKCYKNILLGKAPKKHTSSRVYAEKNA